MTIEFVERKMTYILTKDRPQNSHEEWQSHWLAYTAYLESVKQQLPHSAYAFATAPWHYDFLDHRAPHDSWLEEFIIQETASGERQEKRTLEIIVRLLAAYHDGHIELRYSDVLGYSFALGAANSSGHGDWLYDEVRLSEQRRTLHEVEWSRGGNWLIECRDITYTWIPFDSATSE